MVPHVDCSEVRQLKISRPACLAIVASACEVFPDECMGTLCCLGLPKHSGSIDAAFPFQLAKRYKEEVQSHSYLFFNRMIKKSVPWHTIGSYHSHTCYSDKHQILAYPSETDLEGMSIGELEVIVRTMRKRKRNINSWQNTRQGNISVAWGKFQFLLCGFVRERDYDEYNVPLYRKIELRLI